MTITEIQGNDRAVAAAEKVALDHYGDLPRDRALRLVHEAVAAALATFHNEQREGDDGAASWWQDKDGVQHHSHRPASRWRRLVGPWERVR